MAEEIDFSDTLAGLIIRRHPEREDMLRIDSWSNGIGKPEAAALLRQVADAWDAEAEGNDAPGTVLRPRPGMEGLN
jgi:hypothetical protein